MAASGELLPLGETGEVVIRGENVFDSYENNPQATVDAFTNGWFRTGDQGVKDVEGYLAITGRLKELINRGGEKISPLEVDEIIMDHPAVAEHPGAALCTWRRRIATNTSRDPSPGLPDWGAKSPPMPGNDRS